MDIIAGKYELIREIGAGGSSTVFLANHIALQQKVVLKKLFSVNSSLEINRLEVDILKNLQHEHLPRVYDFVIEGGHAYSVMEYISGQSLGKLMEEGYIFKEYEVIQWAKALCDTLAYLHSQKPAVLHCDIKPSNIILSESGKIYLIDFNISSYIERNHSNMYGYTAKFASPEQKKLAHEKLKEAQSADDKTVLLDEKDEKLGQVTAIDERTDIYSLGATLFYLLSGVSYNNIGKSQTRNKKLSKKLRKILARSLQEDREKRFQSAKSMLYNFEQLKKPKRSLVWICLFVLLIIATMIYLIPICQEQTTDLAEQAAASFQNGEYEQAMLLYQELADNEFNAEFYNVKIADCYYHIGNTERALEYMRERYTENSLEIYRNKIVEYLIEKCQKTGNIEEKIAWEEECIQLGGQNKEIYLDLLQYYASQTNYDMLQQCIVQIKEKNLDIDVEKYEEILVLIDEYQTVFHDIYIACQNEDEDALIQLCYNGDYYKMTRLIGEPLFYDKGEGVVLGIYNNGFLYFGEIENGIRNGNGLWIGIGVCFFVYDGEWRNDLPNGHGIFVCDSYEGYQEYESDVINGIMDGKCDVITQDRENGILSGSPYTYTYVNKMGHPQEYTNEIIKKIPSGYFRCISDNYILVAEVDILGDYIFLPSNELRCVWGLGLEGE